MSNGGYIAIGLHINNPQNIVVTHTATALTKIYDYVFSNDGYLLNAAMNFDSIAQGNYQFQLLIDDVPIDTSNAAASSQTSNQSFAPGRSYDPIDGIPVPVTKGSHIVINVINTTNTTQDGSLNMTVKYANNLKAIS